MRLDDEVSVTCTDTDKVLSGRVVRLKRDHADIAIGDLLISVKMAKPGLWVGSRAGMEFVVRSE